MNVLKKWFYSSDGIKQRLSTGTPTFLHISGETKSPLILREHFVDLIWIQRATNPDSLKNNKFQAKISEAQFGC